MGGILYQIYGKSFFYEENLSLLVVVFYKDNRRFINKPLKNPLFERILIDFGGKLYK
jgi:hypothetical protein